MPKPATVEDEEPSATEDMPVPATIIPVAPAAPSAVEKSTYAGSVNELQGKFEELLINHPRTAPAPASNPYAPCPYSWKPEVNVPRKPEANACEIKVTRGAAAREKWFAELAAVSNERQNALRNHTGAPTPPTCASVTVYCNNCSNPIPDEHYHCSTCDEGDFDLCQTCVKDGVLCGGEDHWMIKRFVKGGKVINSTTETIAPKAPTSFASESKTTLVQQEEEEEELVATRTCNSCIQELTEENFVTCTSCEDFDLCISCHHSQKHGHHPKHAFIPAVEDTDLDVLSQALLGAGRNVGHNAICDGCDKFIYGVRNKCLDCPDWDFCSSCIPNASFIHAGHRFVPIYEPLNDAAVLARSYRVQASHRGIFCDGPLCSAGTTSQLYIKGDRYKCAVCHDTDFCANCEASPSNTHNKTHPLIKFKTPVRNVSVTTLGDHANGKPLPTMGDRCTRNISKATETTPAQSTNAATQVQTVAEMKPSEPVKVEEKTPEVKQEAKELPAPVIKEEFIAHFVRDSVADGSVLPPNSMFEQTWYLRNGGNTAWPAGCTVKFVGGDNMCAVDPEHPASVHELVSAAESTTCYTEVAPGQEYGFTVLMRTPSRQGNFISYWRLTTSDGEKFGHRLWCDVNVKEQAPIVKAEPEVRLESKGGNQMIFPKLEKESPAASLHQQAEIAHVDHDAEADEFEDFVDEPLEDDETDDGFLTDEEYDILDASDEEYLAEQEKITKK